MILAQNRKVTNASKILKLAEGLELFTDPSGTAWVGLPGVGGYPEYVPIKSGKFTGWVSREFYKRFGQPVGQKAIDDARNVLIGLAANIVKPVYVRVANLGDRVYYDGGTFYAEIDGEGWRVIGKPPVAFRRPASAMPVPNPESAVFDYGERVNFADVFGGAIGLSGDALTMITAWLIGAFNDRDYPILVLNGEQGCGKSTLAELLKILIDPSEVPLRTAPRDEQALAVAAFNSWVVALDNLSSVPDWLSDALCRLSTGAGWSARRLFFDLEEILARTQRPVVLNGIPELATRGDLQDRSIVITLPAISDLQRRTKGEIMADFEAARPKLLSLLFDAVSAAIRFRNVLKVERPPRMADFANWAARGFQVATCGGADEFLKAYTENRAASVLSLLDLSPIAQELQTLAAKQKRWTGTVSDLKDKLVLQALGTPTEKIIQQMSLKALNGELRRLAPVLRQAGVSVEILGLQRVNGVVGRFVEVADLNVQQKVSVP